MTRDLLFGQPPDKTDLMVAGEEIDGMSCMCGCHVMDDPANAGMRCDFCGCIASMHKLMRESGRLPTRRERMEMDRERRMQEDPYRSGDE